MDGDTFDNPIYYDRLRQMYANSIPANAAAGDLIYGSGRKKKSHKRSSWISHVKKYAKDHGMSYGDALSRAGPSFRGRGLLTLNPTSGEGYRRKRRSTKKRTSRKRRAGFLPFLAPILGSVASAAIPYVAKKIGLGSRAGAFVGGAKDSEIAELRKYNRELKKLKELKEYGLSDALPIVIPQVTEEKADTEEKLANDYKNQMRILRGRQINKKLVKLQRSATERKNKAEAKFAKKMAALDKKLLFSQKALADKKVKEAEYNTLAQQLGNNYINQLARSQTLALDLLGTGYSSFYDGLLGSGRRRKRKTTRRRRSPSMSLSSILGMGLSAGGRKKKNYH